MSYKDFPFYLDVGQRAYLDWIERSIWIRDEAGVISQYKPLHYQINFHKDCLVCCKDPPDRISSKSRKTGATLMSQIDRVAIGMRLPGIWLPFSSITKEVGRTPLEWLKIILDNAHIETKVQHIKESPDIQTYRAIPRRKDLITRVQLIDNGTEFFAVPGQNPNAMRSFGTVAALNDEFGRCMKAVELYQATVGTIVERRIHEGYKPVSQHDILSTMPDQPGHYFNELLDLAVSLNKHTSQKKGWQVYHQEMFPVRFFDVEKSIYPRSTDEIGNYDLCQLDEEYYNAYIDGDLKKMFNLCDQAWDAGLWETFNDDKIVEGEKYLGLWDEDRGLIPLCPWFPLEKRENVRPSRLIFMREFQADRESASGALLPLNVIKQCATLPVRERDNLMWAYELQGDPKFSYYLGVDFGGTGVVQSHNAGFTVAKIQNHKLLQVYTRMIERINTPRQFKMIQFLCRIFPTIRLVGIDYTGAGRGLGDLASQPGALTKRVALLTMNAKEPVLTGLQEPQPRREFLYSEGEALKSNLRWQIADHLRMIAWNGSCEFLNDPVVMRDLNMPDEATLHSSRDTKTGSHAEIFWSTGIAFWLPLWCGYDLPDFGVGVEKARQEKGKRPIHDQAREIAQQIGFPVADDKALSKVRRI